MPQFGTGDDTVSLFAAQGDGALNWQLQRAGGLAVFLDGKQAMQNNSLH